MATRTTSDVQYAGDGLVSRSATREERGRRGRRTRTIAYRETVPDSEYWVDGVSTPNYTPNVGSNTPTSAGSNLAPRQEEERKALLLSGGDSSFVPEQRAGASRLEDEAQFIKRRLSAFLVS